MQTKELIKSFVQEKSNRQCNLLGISIVTLKYDTDLVKEGIFDSLSFVDLIGIIENEFKVNIDLEKYNPADFTKFGKLIEIFENATTK
jgi:acyl carrier protein